MIRVVEVEQEVRKKRVKLIAFFMAFSGILIIGATLYPIVSYEWMARYKYPLLVSPVSDNDKADYYNKGVDYTRASNWFAREANYQASKSPAVEFYTLSIPKLKIDSAIVATNSDDLSQHLAQYPGTAEPGMVGNTVIFGHSVLPIFFNPKNYISIFSTLYKLDIGDEITVSYDGINYTYKVQDMFEVRPVDVQVLDQAADTSYLELITCTPPGDPRKPKRLVVRAKIVPVQKESKNEILGY
ncbi:hypothetical protein A2115_01675 [Candidatus Woesebacteria bacterium GWA1_41_8]|uniref:Sortase n=1 Tax=Candidatus Woesebacteria bacterium GWA1_41_8 TaxID=1802471 RepID=A0A1F7WIZ6_9BACT|nr:MAG: hypothetical protein A2115_01675 [Candidatus Woesebacteria bacterium GWA1_41_8]